MKLDFLNGAGCYNFKGVDDDDFSLLYDGGYRDEEIREKAIKLYKGGNIYEDKAKNNLPILLTTANAKDNSYPINHLLATQLLLTKIQDVRKYVKI